MMCFFHKWSKWEQYTESGRCALLGLLVPKDLRGKPFDYTEKRQYRICQKCGKKQDELVSTN